MPVELTLHKDENKISMHAAPVRDLIVLVGNVSSQVKFPASDKATSRSVIERLDGYRFSVLLEFQGTTSALIELGSVSIQIDVGKLKLTCRQVTVPIQIKNNRIEFDVLMDRGSLELFLNQGATAISVGADLSSSVKTFKVTSHGGTATLKATGTSLESIGKK